MNGTKPAKLRPSRVQEAEAEQKQSPRFPRDVAKKPRGNFGVKKAKMNVDLARARMKTAQEAARAAAQAVAEAEAAATAAEQAAREAEAAEAEAEAAEAAAEAAQAAIRPPKKGTSLSREYFLVCVKYLHNFGCCSLQQSWCTISLERLPWKPDSRQMPVLRRSMWLVLYTCIKSVSE